MSTTSQRAAPPDGNPEQNYALVPESAATRTDARRSLSIAASSIALVAGKVTTMALGFVFWLVAARFFAPAEVGLAAGAISAVMLCTQVALLGLGSAVILQFPRDRERPAPLLDTAFTAVTVSSAAAAAVFLLVASGWLEELRVVASEPEFAAAFVCMSVFGTVGILLDQVSTALRRGDQVFLRAIVFGAVTVSAAGALAGVFDARSSAAIFSTWVVSALIAVVIGLVQLRRMLAGYRYRPRLQPRTARRLFAAGIPNHALTMTERAPGLILPIVVTELLSAEANAAWYAAWMMAWVVYIVPIQIGMTLFAEAAHKTASLVDLLRHGVRLSLSLGAVGAIVFAAGAQQILAILGPSYASSGATPLRILVIAVVPLTFVQVYYIVCRSTGRLREATVAGAITGTASVAIAAVAATRYGLVGIALAWLGVQLAAGVWATVRVLVIAPREDDRAMRRSATVQPVGASS